MTDGEKMVWAAAFVAAFRAGEGPIDAATDASIAVGALEDAAGRDNSRATEMCLGEEPSDVEAALVELLSSWETVAGPQLAAAARMFRADMGVKLGRPLRGAK